MSEELRQVAKRLKEIREICGVSPDEAAARLGVAAEQYLAFEDSGEDIPISALYELAQLYGLDITELLTGKSPRLSDYCVVRHGQSTGIDRYPGYHFESLAYKFKRRIMEPLLVTVEPGDENCAPVTHPGQEFNFVVEGAVTITIGSDSVTLYPGDCVYFDPTLPHSQTAAEGKTARFLTVIAE